MQHAINVGGKLFPLHSPKIMGILNLTPDSFYDGGKHFSSKDAIARASQMLAEGADILDIGAQSTRPGAIWLDAETEWRRMQPVLRQLVTDFPEAVISVDTFYAEVAKRAADCGAHIINDVSGGTLDPDMFATVGALKLPYILMHMRGTPQTMKNQTQYTDLVADIAKELAPKVAELRALGLNDIIIDPGFGFAKTIEQNFELLNRLEDLQILELPVLVGLSRKSMIYKTLQIEPDAALNGTTALHAWALCGGANILRVHDVKQAKEVVILHGKLKGTCNF